MATGALALPGVGASQGAAAATVAAATETANSTVMFAPASSGVLAPGSPLELTGTISNSTKVAIPAGTATVYLNRTPLASRSELSTWLNPASTSASDRLGTVVLESPTPQVDAGRTVSVQLTVPASSINFGTQAGVWGARTLAVRVTAGGSELGQSRGSVVWNPGGGVPRTGLAIAMPLTVPQSSDALISSDLLANYTSPGGLLSRQLDNVDGTAVAIGVDPRIVASIRILGPTAPPSAIAWLARLAGLTNDTFALSYADSDLAAVSQAKPENPGPRVLQPTSFPIDPQLFPSAAPTPSESPTGETPTPTPSPQPTQPTVPDAQSLQALPYTIHSVAWPADDTVVESDLDNFQTGGLTTTILSSGNVGYSGLNYTPSAPVMVGKHPALISDASISSYLQAAVSATTAASWANAMSDLSSTLAVTSAERPTDSRTLFATLDRSTPGADVRMSETLGALAALPWAGPASLKELATAPATTATQASVVPKPESAARIGTVGDLLNAEARAGSFSSVLSDPTQITGERRLTLLAILANSWANDTTWSAATKKYLATSSNLLNSVSLAKSSSAIITATNSNLPITVSNQLDWPVTVYVTVRSPTGILSIANERVELTIEAQSQAKANVPARSNANGNATLRVSLSSATNVSIAGPVPLNVDVQAGWETAFTAVVAVLLIGVFAFGIYRNIARRRKAKKARDGTAPDPDPLDPALEATPEARKS
ncbi:MAG: hypothetical protein JWM49_2463 [Microbacteriaceae bacterium]|nr:hypothetical protein [Microbacteriaceae bacterium]